VNSRFNVEIRQWCLSLADFLKLPVAAKMLRKLMC